MAFTESSMMPLGTQAPDFTLLDAVSGMPKNLQSLKGGKGTVVMFICNHCPYVKHINPELKRISDDYLPKGIHFIAINSNDVENYPDDAPDKMKALVENLAFNFPFLFDETQEVAKAYDAACTPDFFAFDESLKLAYRGRLDSSTPGNGNPLTGADLRVALDAILEGIEVSEPQYPSGGCNIKWKK